MDYNIVMHSIACNHYTTFCGKNTICTYAESQIPSRYILSLLYYIGIVYIVSDFFIYKYTQQPYYINLE